MTHNEKQSIIRRLQRVEIKKEEIGIEKMNKPNDYIAFELVTWEPGTVPPYPAPSSILQNNQFIGAIR